MANVTVANYVPDTNQSPFSVVWKLTRAMKKAGWTYKSSSNGVSKDTTGTATNDKWGGSVDPASDTYAGVTLATGSWICFQGPSTLKIPITTAPTGTFNKGENVTQGTTGAKGECLGVVFDTVGLTGWMVVKPRVDGSGADPHGWDHTHTVTGDVSAATLTPSATVIEFVTEIVFWRGANLFQGNIYYQCVDQSAESTSRYSYLAVNAAGVSATIAPGGGGTGNTFPAAGSWVMCGLGGANTTPSDWCASQSLTTPCLAQLGNCGQSQIMVANATYSAGVSADGSFIMALGSPAIDAGTFTGFALQALDDTEDGDVQVYATIYAGGTTSRTQNSAPSNATDSKHVWSTLRVMSSTISPFGCFRRRGMASGDAWLQLNPAMLAVYNAAAGTSTNCSVTTPGDVERVANDPATLRTLVSEPVWLVSMANTTKIRKGTMRWLRPVLTGNGTDTWVNKTWVQLDSNLIGFVGGPYDGASTPTNA